MSRNSSDNIRLGHDAEHPPGKDGTVPGLCSQFERALLSPVDHDDEYPPGDKVSSVGLQFERVLLSPGDHDEEHPPGKEGKIHGQY